MLISRKLHQLDELRLLPHPALALCGTAQVHRAVAIPIRHVRLRVGELGVVVTLCREHAAAVQTVYGHPRRLECAHQVLCVLAHLPAIREAHILKEALVVAHCVVGGGGLDEHLVGWPGVGVWEQPDGGDSSALLLPDFQRADHWDAVIIT